mgnify:CR=1 FL=1
MKTELFGPGSYIFKEGDLSQEAYRIIRGKVELTTDVDSKPVILAQLGKGDIFGEMAMIDERPRTASAQCLKPTECEVMQPGDFQSVILDQPARSLPYLSALFERLRSAVHSSRLGASNASILGCKKLRCHHVYRPRRHWLSPLSAIQSRTGKFRFSQ